jgi:hypothetical protein
MSDQLIPQIPVMVRPNTPVPFGVRAESGDVRPPFQPPDPTTVALDSKQVQERGAPQKHLGIIPTLDPKKITDTGWGVLFASDADPAIKVALDPLLKLREQQVANPAYFKIFDGAQGVLPDQTAISWLANMGVGLATVDPDNGIPYHLLIVGSPTRISFEFQYTLDLQWSVGRLDFDTTAEFAAYAKAVVDYETAAEVRQGKKVVMWMPANGDLATNLLCNDVGLPFLQKPIGMKQGFDLTAFIATRATKPTLSDIFTGKALDNGPPPALLFTGSHGLEVGPADPTDQRERQGALVTQEWQPGKPVGNDACFAAADLSADADLRGMIHVIFACFGGGCPEADNYPTSGTPVKPLMSHAVVGRLPQRLLAKGALAVVGHIDRAWSFSFQTGSGLPQNQLLRSILEGIMLGFPVGYAMDVENLQWGTYAALLGIALGPVPGGPPPAALANLVIARDDARNYALFGDPAVRLRVDKMV